MKLSTKKKNFIPLILAALVIVSVVVSVSLFATAESEKKAELLNLGEKYLTELNYEDAIAAFEQILSIDPKNEEAYEGIINAYIGMGDYEKAREYSKKGYEQTGNESVKEIVDVYMASEEYQNMVAKAPSKDDTAGNAAETAVLSEVKPEETKKAEEEPEEII